MLHFQRLGDTLYITLSAKNLAVKFVEEFQLDLRRSNLTSLNKPRVEAREILKTNLQNQNIKVDHLSQSYFKPLINPIKLYSTLCWNRDTKLDQHHELNMKETTSGQTQ